ncbi:MAG: ABC transporter substrate-binding protein [Synergistaceae bacterium]|jgi:peptide/nickel transport system substrate-binding protein|nr:ABC transporter substrate-binding protein [Synergistaceae bacterium]
MKTKNMKTRNMWRRAKSVRLFILLWVVLLSASAAWAAEKSIVVGLASDTLFLDPQQQNETITNAITQHVYESLIAASPDGSELVPTLAESWEIAPDQLTWTFHLRKGVKFSDGTPFTAEDVKFTFERAGKFLVKNRVGSIKDIEVVDDHTLKIVTKMPDAVLLDNLELLKIMSKAYTEKVGDDEVNLKPMGTGPYVCVEWVKEDHITLEANKNYWGGAPAISHVRFRPITNAATRTAALLTGEVDLIEDIPVRDVDRVKKTEGIKVSERPGMRLIYMHIDANREPTPGIDGPVNPMKDVRVRRAMSLGIDRQAIVDVIMNGNGYPTGQMLIEGKRGYLKDLPVPEHNPDKAKELLKEAGYEKGFKVKLDAPNGRYPNDAQVAQAIASQLAKVGIEIDPILHPKSTFFDYVRPGDKSSLVMTGWSEEIDTGAMANTLFYTRGKNPAKGASNRCHYSNDEYDRLIDEADQTADVAKRAELLTESTRVILDDVGIIPLFFNQDIYGSKAKVKFTPRANKYILAYELDVEE